MSRHRAQEAGRQSLLAGRTAKCRAPKHERVRTPHAAGPLEEPGRQGPRPLDAFRRQRVWSRQAVLEEFLHGPAPRSAGGVVRRLRPPPAGRRLWRKGRRAGRSPQGGLSRLYQPQGRPLAVVEGRAAAEVDQAIPLGKGHAPRRPLPAHLLPVEVPSRRGAQGVSGGRFAPAAVSWQPRLLRRAALLEAPARLAAGHPDSAITFALSPRGAALYPHPAVGLAA